MVVSWKQLQMGCEEQKLNLALSEDSASNLLTDAIEVVQAKHHDRHLLTELLFTNLPDIAMRNVTAFLKACSDIPRRDFVTLGESREQFFYRNGDNPNLRGTLHPTREKPPISSTPRGTFPTFVVSQT